MDLRPPDEVGNVLGRDRHFLRRAIGNLARDLAAELADFALELADAGFPCVTRDDRRDRVFLEDELIGPQTILPQLARHKIALPPKQDAMKERAACLKQSDLAAHGPNARPPAQRLQ